MQNGQQTDSNRRRIFDSVVSVDAWHSAFSQTERTASVHVDVSFLVGKLGDDPDSSVRFQISLKRAELVFIIPDTEPLAVIQSSVKRERPVVIDNVVIRQDVKKRAITSRFLAAIMPANVSADLALQMHYSTNEDKTAATKQSTGSIVWAQSRLSSGDYKWQLTPAQAPNLLGKAWDAVAEPLLRMSRTESQSPLIDAVARVEIRCRREDLIISGVKIKSRPGLQKILSSNKKAAVEAYIRAALSSKDLSVRNFCDPYGEVTLADLYIGEQIEP